jgi:hypothetical protein
MIRVFGESLSAPSTASRVAGNRPPFLPLPASPEDITVTNYPVAQGYWHAALCRVPTARVDLFEDRTRSGEGQARRISSSSVIALGPRSRYLAAASKQMPNAIITTPVTAHRPRPVMNEPPISSTPWPRKMPPTPISRRPRPPAMLRSISTTSVAIELDQPLVADPEVMRDLVEHDVPDLAA